MAKDRDGNLLSAGDQVNIPATLDATAPPPPEDNALLSVTLTVPADDGSMTTLTLWSMQLVKVMGAGGAPTRPGERPQSQHVSPKAPAPASRPSR